MTRKSSCHGLDMLAEIPDPRNNKGKRHPLVSILALVVIGLMCGHNGWTSIATWARSQPALAKALGFTHKKTPCSATIHNLLRRLDVVALEDILTKWVNTVIQSRPDLIDCLKVVAMDGKTMRATRKQDATISHLLSVVSHELGVTLTQRSVSDKTNEIPIFTEILEAFDVSGKIITTDALLTQRAFCEQVVDADGDYVLPIKKNQAFLYWTIETLFQSEDATRTTNKATTALEAEHPDMGEIFDSFQTYNKEHGRLETRCLKASTALNAYLADWPGLAQVIEYRQVRKNMHTSKETYNLYSAVMDADLRDLWYACSKQIPCEAKSNDTTEFCYTVLRSSWHSCRYLSSY